MIHYLKLQPHPFLMIAQGKKTIELRLLDEKRKKITVGDTLVFSNTEEPDAQITCTVIRLHIFSSFEELYQALPLEKCGYLPEELVTASAKDMEIYYPAEKQANYGVVGIELELILTKGQYYDTSTENERSS